MKGFALGLTLKQRRKATRKSPIASLEVESKTELFFQSSNSSNSFCCDNANNKVALSLLFRFSCISAILFYPSWLQGFV